MAANIQNGALASNFRIALKLGPGISPSPLYSGERGGVRGGTASCAPRRSAPHPNPLPRVLGRGKRAQRGGLAKSSYLAAATWLWENPNVERLEFAARFG